MTTAFSRAFIDDDENLRGRHILGLKVLGSERDLDVISHKETINELWVSVYLREDKTRRLEEFAVNRNVKMVKLSEVGAFSNHVAK